MVWVSSRYCGVGKARSRSGKIVVVAHYAPPGNQSGGYLDNVLPPGGRLPKTASTSFATATHCCRQQYHV
ncbi:unnamed protein product [Callosobruchus maculatus]|uniref:SCP domain-containing protein n=1 Tax=Callosobruchus maculatus TaxID=64391 RepID=A0A653DQU0_CALMS|nr:unnamed protein product [Callosobruchus maculatus]